MKKSIYISDSAGDTRRAGASLGKRLFLRPYWQKTVFLIGDLGSGKTTFLQGLAREFDKNIKLKSPSYTVAVEYPFDREGEPWKFVHFDLFRLGEIDKKRDEIKVDHWEQVFELLQERIQEKNTVVVVEWADLLGCRSPISAIKGSEPRAVIEVKLLHKGKSKRGIEVDFIDSGVPSDEVIEDLLKEYQTPRHVRAHQEGVAMVANLLAESMLVKGILLDLKLVNAAARLHDLVRLANFKDLNYEQFDEDICSNKKEIWKKQMEKWGKHHHGDAAALILCERGLCSCAKVISHHKSKAIFMEDEMAMEEKIVFFADKKMLHDQIVSVRERLHDGRTRHALDDKKRQRELEKRIIELGDELFELAGFESEEEFDMQIADSG